jgi:hypothetical protein
MQVWEALRSVPPHDAERRSGIPTQSVGTRKKETLMEKVLRIVSLKNQPSDNEYWISRPITERLDAIEILRKQYLGFKKDVEPRLQRVCRVIKPT